MRTYSSRNFLVALAVTLAAALPAFAQAPAEKPAALVNGEAVSMAEVRAVLDLRPSPVPLTAAQQKELRHAALDTIIDDVLMRQFLKKVGGAASAEAVNKELEDLKVILRKQSKTYEQFLHEAKQTDAQLKADVVARLQWKNYLQARFSEAEIKTYYDANKLHFDKVEVRASHILVKVDPKASAMEKGLARAKLETIRAEIVMGKMDFLEAAKRYSECPSKEKGGDIGFFPYKFIAVEAVAKAAFAMKVGEISDLVTTEFGFHIIKVTDRTPGEPSTFEAVRGSIRDVIAQEQELFSRILADQRKTAKIEVLLP